MAVQKVAVEEFLAYSINHPVLDVRSPAEYSHAHIPGATSMPLFTDEERKVVGTLYKQRSREEAIKQGLDFFGPKMRAMVEQVEKMLSTGKNFSDNTVLVHCWRGGMRSGAVSWLLGMYGFKVYTLDGGYKKYRKYVLNSFNQDYPFRIVGGYTGSGKTYILRELKRNRKLVVDLEGIANHKGSAFGGIGQPSQPSQEMFENLLCQELVRAKTLSAQSPDGHIQSIWLEDESMRIGSLNIPSPIWNQMRVARVHFLDIPFEARLNYLVQEYGSLETEKMVNAIIRISKRLGGLETKTAINLLLEGDKKGSFDVLLRYYDKLYLKGLHNRPSTNEQVITIPSPVVDASSNAARILNSLQPITSLQ